MASKKSVLPRVIYARVETQEDEEPFILASESLDDLVPDGDDAVTVGVYRLDPTVVNRYKKIAVTVKTNG